MRKKMKRYIVYEHLFPNGKRYFGITCKKDAKKRWENGFGYTKTKQPVMYNAIKKYGWENILHLILFEDLTKKQANEKEKELIKKYKTNCKKYGNEFGYNMTDGGDGTCGHICSTEARTKISEAHKRKRMGSKNHMSKPIICDGKKYESTSIFCHNYGLCCSTVEKWLHGKAKMPLKWYYKGLCYENQKDLIIPQEKPHNYQIKYDNQIFNSQSEFAKYINKSPAQICKWIKTDSIPLEYIKKGFERIK